MSFFVEVKVGKAVTSLVVFVLPQIVDSGRRCYKTSVEMPAAVDIDRWEAAADLQLLVVDTVVEHLKEVADIAVDYTTAG